MKFFSNPYYDYLKQRTIEDLIEEGKIEEAVSLTESLPQGIGFIEKIERLKVTVQSYRAMINKYQNLNGKLNGKEIEEIREKLRIYETIGLTEEEINEGKKHTAEYYQDNLRLLEKFKEFGEYEDVKKALEEYEELLYKDSREKELELLERALDNL